MVESNIKKRSAYSVERLLYGLNPLFPFIRIVKFEMYNCTRRSLFQVKTARAQNLSHWQCLFIKKIVQERKLKFRSEKRTKYFQVDGIRIARDQHEYVPM